MPVIACLAHDVLEWFDEALAAGCNDFVNVNYRRLPMRAFTEKSKTVWPTTSTKSSAVSRDHVGQRRDRNSTLKLQRTVGNQAALRLLRGNAEGRDAILTNTASRQFGHDFARIPITPHKAGALQTKPSVNKPGDQYEQEADRVAEVVMRMPGPQAPRACPCGGGCPKCQALQPGQGPERSQVMRVGLDNTGPSDVSPITHEILHSPGQSLDDSTRGYFEPRFGYDFRHVRVHSGRQAEQVARSINAKAFTVGNHIVFGGAQPPPTSREGQQLLSHELTHVIQQSGASGIHATGGGERHGMIQRQFDPAGAAQGEQQRLCGPDITTSLNTMLGTVGPWFRGLSTFRKHRSCVALGPGAPLVGVNPIMAWDTRELFLPNTGWLDAYFRSRSCGSPRDVGCDTDPSRNLCETAGSCGNSVVVGGQCLLAGTANYALFGTMCRLCHDETSQWGRWDMRAIIGAYKSISGDDATPPREVASAAYDGTFPALPAAAENRGTCTGRCGLTYGGAFDFIWEPYRPR